MFSRKIGGTPCGSFRKKTHLALVAALAAISLTAGCGRKQVKNDVALQLSPSESGCLTALKASAVKYMDGTASEEETSRMWDCGARALQLFTDNTRGEKPGVYTPQELRAFLRKYFLNGAAVPDGFVREAMEIKRVMIGGGLDSLTLSEIQKIRELVQIFRTESLRLRPHMPLTPAMVLRRSPEQIDAAVEAITQSAQVLGAVLQTTGTPYTWVRLEALLREIDLFQHPGGGLPSSIVRQICDKIPHVRTIKGLLFGRAPRDRIAGDEWRVLLHVSAQWYGIYLQFLSFNQRYPSWEQGAGLEAFVEIANRGVTLVQEAIERHPGGQIPVAKITELVNLFLPTGHSGLVRELMELKRAVLGGKIESLASVEFQKIPGLIQTLRTEVQRLRPHLPLTPAVVQQRDAEQIDAAAEAILASARALGQVLQATGAPYSWERLEGLLGEIELFQYPAGESPPESLARQFADHLPYIRAVKGLWSGTDSPDRIAGDEWLGLFEASARGYAVYLKFLHFNRQSWSWEYGAGREALVDLANRGLVLLQEAVARHPGQTLSFAQLDDLVDLFLPGDIEIFDGRKVANSHLKPLLRPVVRRVMGGTVRGSTGRSASGLTPDALQRLLDKLEHWSLSQAYLERVFAEMVRRHPGATPLLGYTGAELNEPSLDALFSARELTPALRDAAHRMRTLAVRERMLFAAADAEVSFSSALTVPRHTLAGLAKMNWMFLLGRVFAEGYAEDPARAASEDDAVAGVNVAELQLFVEDIRAVAVDLLFMEAGDKQLADKRFLEASLFTYPGNGDAVMDVRETSHLLALMVSAKLLADRAHAELATTCPTRGLDQFGSPAIDTRCYRDQFFARGARYWRRMPLLEQHYQELLKYRGYRNEWLIADFEKSYETGARKQGYSDKIMDSSDSEGFAAIGQYVESLFAKFDTDASGALDHNESVVAFPIFRQKLKEMTCAQGSCLTSEKDLFAVFSYLLAHGWAPSKFQFIKWRYLSRKSVYADRSRILKIFAMISQE